MLRSNVSTAKRKHEKMQLQNGIRIPTYMALAASQQYRYAFVQLTAGYKTSLNVEISCAITVQRRVNYGNFMNIFVYRNHVDY